MGKLAGGRSVAVADGSGDRGPVTYAMWHITTFWDFWYRCYFPHLLRNSVSPVWEICLINIWTLLVQHKLLQIIFQIPKNTSLVFDCKAYPKWDEARVGQDAKTCHWSLSSVCLAKGPPHEYRNTNDKQNLYGLEFILFNNSILNDRRRTNQSQGVKPSSSITYPF